MRAATVWLTGLPGSGKTSVAYEVQRRLAAAGSPACVLDGDTLRHGLSSDLDFSREGRRENVRRAAEVAALLTETGVVALCSLVSPFAEDRASARRVHDEHGLRFIEVWVDTSVDICAQRDPKGLYRRARAGEIADLTGVDAPYEAPLAPELVLHGGADPLDENAGRVLDALEGVSHR